MIRVLFSDKTSIMKKLKNKFIITVIWIIVCIIFSQVYIAYSRWNIDTNSYLELVKWNGTLNESQLDLHNKYILHSWDKIRIIGKSSLGVITWGDGSLTRLGGNTKISIQDNQISRDYTNINISFDLISGKTWSQVVSFIGRDSSFTQSFNGLEAGIRGTVFDVDLSQDFIHVSDHQIYLKDAQGDTFIIQEGVPFKLSTLSILDIQEFLETLQDTAWVDLNKKFDDENVQKLKKQLQDSLESKNPFLFLLDFISPKYRILYELDTAQEYENIEKLLIKIPENKKGSIYTAVLSKYQSMNFISARDYEFYKRKIFYKRALVFLADYEDKQQFIESSMYDLQDILETGDLLGIQESLSFLQENTDIIQNIDASFLQDSIENIPSALKDEFRDSLESIRDIFQWDVDISPKDITHITKDGLNTIDSWIQDFLDKNLWETLEKISK